MKSKTKKFSVHGLTFAAQAWGNPTGFPVLALHGWLDNSSSFYRLAPLLENAYVVAVDLAGHGQSSHRPHQAPYNIWEDVAEIFAIADQLKWHQFSLLGHSRGGIISTIAAGTFPERIQKLALIEGLLPEPITLDQFPAQLARSIQGLQTQSKKSLSVYPTIKAAINAREKGMFPLSHESATALTRRGVKKVDQGYIWSTDPKLLVPSAVKLMPEQMGTFIQRITSPSRLIMANSGMPKMFPGYLTAVSRYSNIDIQAIEGGHHLHMEEESVEVAKILNEFFSK